MNTRNWKFDYLKGIACIIVVFLHCPFPGIPGDLIIYALRFSVPVFFMITGYYSYAKDDSWFRKKALQYFLSAFFLPRQRASYKKYEK